MHSHHIAAALVTMAALAPSAASARPVDTVPVFAARGDAAPAQDLRSPDARDAADGRGTFNSPDAAACLRPGRGQAGA